MAILSLWHTKAVVKMIGKELKNIAFIANIIAQVAMLASLIYNLVTSSGLWYINLSLLVLSIAYFIFTIIKHVKDIKKTTKKEIKRIIKWSIRVLKVFPITIAIYGLLIASSNLTPITLISPILITAMWIFDVLINIAYLIIEAKIDLFLDCVAEDLGDTPFPGKIIRETTEKLPNHTPTSPKF